MTPRTPELIVPRRKLIAGLAALVCAPAIVRATSLMGVKPIPTGEEWVRIVAYDWADVSRIQIAYRVTETAVFSANDEAAAA
jgi:hypothetical protein